MMMMRYLTGLSVVFCNKPVAKEDLKQWTEYLAIIEPTEEDRG